MTPLARTVSLVLGASQGIGAEIARALSRDGSTVVLASRRPEAVEAIAGEIVGAGGRALGLACDVSDPAAVEAAVARALADFGRLDHVVNNAAIIQPVASIEDGDPADWAKAVAIGLCGTFNGSAAALHHFRRSGSGVLLNMSSGAAHRPVEGWSAYCAAKAGALALFRSIALETAGTGIRAYAFQPGAVDTGMLEAVRERGLGDVARIPTNDLLPPEIPARAVAWLMREEAGDLSGRELSIRDPVLRARIGLPERHYA